MSTRQDKEPNVSIIILNYNGYQDTIECIESLFKMNYSNFHVIIVDNGSKNDSLFKLKAWLANKNCARDKLLIIENSENEGFARGNNIGIRYALDHLKSEYIMTLNNDTLVKIDFLLPLLEKLKQPEVALVGPKIIEDDPSLHWQNYFLKRPNLFRYLAFLTPLRKIFVRTPMAVEFIMRKNNCPKKIYAIPGCCMLFKAKIMDAIGLFDEKTFLGWEECILAEKLHQHKFSTYVVPESIVYHKVTRDSAIIPLAERRDSFLASERYYQKVFLKMPSYQTWIINLIRHLSFARSK